LGKVPASFVMGKIAPAGCVVGQTVPNIYLKNDIALIFRVN